ncbi:hypothetical protein [Methanooceanicella nereidis]|uniref:hypothetical protein n=1 Tax=Methanooceanicella nereidis TaxID=2052831 RepID=UPI001E5E9011|nr:hypothetical protein [Methanocella sp. CWC-04]
MDTNSLAATAFLLGGALVVFNLSNGSIYAMIKELSAVAVITLCIYLLVKFIIKMDSAN